MFEMRHTNYVMPRVIKASMLKEVLPKPTGIKVTYVKDVEGGIMLNFEVVDSTGRTLLECPDLDIARGNSVTLQDIISPDKPFVTLT